jgi:hypothetical protein
LHPLNMKRLPASRCRSKIYAATENLSPLNVIGQGIAGTCQDYDLYIVKQAKYIFYTKT